MFLAQICLPPEERTNRDENGWKGTIDRCRRGGACDGGNRRGMRKLEQQQHDEHHADRYAEHQRPAGPEGRGLGAERDQVEGHAHRGRRRHLRAGRVHRLGRAHRDRDGFGSRQGPRASDGTHAAGQERDVRQHHPGPRREQIRPRDVLLHDHQGAREDGRLRELRERGHVLLRQGLRRPGHRLTRRPLRPEGRRGTRDHPGGRRHGAGQEVQGGGQARGHRQCLSGRERSQPRPVERARHGRDGRLPARHLCRQAVERH